MAKADKSFGRATHAIGHPHRAVITLTGLPSTKARILATMSG